MGTKKFFWLFLICVSLVGMLCLTATADTGYIDYAVPLEDMEHELINMSQVEAMEGNVVRVTGSLNSDIPGNTLAVSDVKFPLEIGETVTINCSYSPASASVDFGVIAPDGYFYFLNVKGGSINQSMVVSQRGTYSVAVRNKSAFTVTVVGFVTC